MKLVQNINAYISIRKKLSSDDNFERAMANIYMARVYYKLSLQIGVLKQKLQNKSINYYTAAVTQTPLEDIFTDEFGNVLYSMGRKDIAYDYLKKAYKFQFKYIAITIAKEPTKLIMTNETLSKFINSMLRCALQISVFLQEEGNFEESQDYCKETLDLVYNYNVSWEIIDNTSYFNLLLLFKNYVANMIFINNFKDITLFFQSNFFIDYYSKFKKNVEFDEILNIKAIFNEGNKYSDLKEIKALKKWNQIFHSKIHYISSSTEAAKVWRDINSVVGNDEIKQSIYSEFNEMLSQLETRLKKIEELSAEGRTFKGIESKSVDSILKESDIYTQLLEIDKTLELANKSINFINDAGVKILKSNIKNYKDQFLKLGRISFCWQLKWCFIVFKRNLVRIFIFGFFMGSLIPMIIANEISEGFLFSTFISIAIMVISEVFIDPQIDVYYTIQFKKLLNSILSNKYSEMLSTYNHYIHIKDLYLSSVDLSKSSNESQNLPRH